MLLYGFGLSAKAEDKQVNTFLCTQWNQKLKLFSVIWFVGGGIEEPQYSDDQVRGLLYKIAETQF